MRLFIAVPVSDEVRCRLAHHQRRLAGAGLPVRLTRPEGLHLTLVFLGEVDEALTPAIEAAMRRASSEAVPVHLGARGLGGFPTRRAPRVVWAGVTGEVDALARVQRDLSVQLREVGMALEDRAFTPHITLGRSTGPWSAQQTLAWQQLLAGEPPAFGTWLAGALHLIRSQLHHAGSRYSTLYTSPLGAANQPPVT